VTDNSWFGMWVYIMVWDVYPHSILTHCCMLVRNNQFRGAQNKCCRFNVTKKLKISFEGQSLSLSKEVLKYLVPPPSPPPSAPHQPTPCLPFFCFYPIEGVTYGRCVVRGVKLRVPKESEGAFAEPTGVSLCFHQGHQRKLLSFKL
jgi:hypothetical protein